MKFKKLKINDWKQFENIEIDFHPNMTVLTGANGAGKTTILNLLSQHFGWNFNELSTPIKDKESGVTKFFARISNLFIKTVYPEDEQNKIGDLTYSDGSVSKLKVPEGNANTPNYRISIEGQQPVDGLYIIAYRPIFNYRAIQTIPARKRTGREAYNLVSNSSRNNAFGQGGEPANFYIKETLISWALFGDGSSRVEAEPEQKEYFDGFEEVLKKILPSHLGFQKFVIRGYEILLQTRTGEFMIDAVSGGISALIDLAWQIYMFSTLNEEEFVVLIDEIENHLHPQLQRTVMHDLIRTFPRVQFIVSTHSPLIVGSVENSNVYAFKYTAENKVTSYYLDMVNKSKTASEMLQDVLGVPFTMPIWVEERLKSILDRFDSNDITSESFKKLRSELAEVGMDDYMPTAIDLVLKNKEVNDQDK